MYFIYVRNIFTIILIFLTFILYFIQFFLFIFVFVYLYYVFVYQMKYQSFCVLWEFSGNIIFLLYILDRVVVVFFLEFCIDGKIIYLLKFDFILMIMDYVSWLNCKFIFQIEYWFSKKMRIYITMYNQMYILCTTITLYIFFHCYFNKP